MRTGRSISRQTHPVAIEDHGQLVLSPRQRETQAILSGQHRPMRQFIKNGDDLFVAQPLNVVAMLGTGQRLPWL